MLEFIQFCIAIIIKISQDEREKIREEDRRKIMKEMKREKMPPII